MINLDVKDYCDHCPYFEPEVDKFYDYTEFPALMTIQCENATKCTLIASHISAAMKKEKNDA